MRFLKGSLLGGEGNEDNECVILEDPYLGHGRIMIFESYSSSGEFNL
jgi:hypothetical protein